MRPAPSIIFFTVLSGAGYGLLFLLGLGAALGTLPATPAFGGVAVATALLLVTAGLVSSTFHLGRPERAWRALSQWRTSWLSREGVAALATYLPAIVLGVTWVGVGGGAWLAAAGIVAAAGAVVTVCCTGMIYASLKPVAEWHSPWVVPVFLGLAAMTGALWLQLLMAVFGRPLGGAALIACLTLLAAWGLVRGYRQRRPAPGTTPGTATGLGRFGAVRLLEPPHSQGSYLLHEMVFRIARKHALRLRRTVAAAGAAALLLTLAAVGVSGWPAAAAAATAVTAGMAAALVERWLFFAEARHTVALYYGDRVA